ncbi:MAG: 2-C-methyl-D-erythritol 4-phosphate cytidylyltransferase [Methylacidiphilales bacterium]|nr:2-C-methyl-D-erythritol 4-phosphate cytidylyltransferase [Candidatus Methylacidiphilales bacterium]
MSNQLLDAPNWVVIPASGIGQRFLAKQPKQYVVIHDKEIITHTIHSLNEIFRPSKIIIPISKLDNNFSKIKNIPPNVHTINGGVTRQDSVMNSLEYLKNFAKPNEWVIVHDAVRPVFSWDLREELIKIENHPYGGHFAIPITDALKKIDLDGAIVPVNRSEFYLSQTPQVFRFEHLYHSLSLACSHKLVFDDEVSAIHYAGYHSVLLTGSVKNIKITYQHDITIASLYLCV